MISCLDCFGLYTPVWERTLDNVKLSISDKPRGSGGGAPVGSCLDST